MAAGNAANLPTLWLATTMQMLPRCVGV